ncbi:rhamnogalacturonan acetylesterase [Powellomyces hirtus]|nr:rhamnogalacturonan acetylesterase [Powellomyces hirtus]
MKFTSLFLALIPALLPSSVTAATTLHLAGDSTGAKGGATGTSGWGPFLQDYFIASKIIVNNAARGGRSTRTFLSEGLWKTLMDSTQPADIVMIQFGHNDASPVTDSARSRGVLRGTGEQFEDTINGVTNKPERVYTFGHYLRTMVKDVRAKGAVPVILAKTLTKKWDNATNGASRSDQWSQWALDVARAEKTAYLDMRNIAADGYDKIGRTVLDTFFPVDGTHTSPEGARFNAEAVTQAFKCIRLKPVIDGLSKAGQGFPTPAKCYNSAAATMMAHESQPLNCER